jgi:murein DD-endopeptidase MepM/ murein hydrolase activator NlpD
MSDRTFVVGRKAMRGDDVKAWQADVNRLFKSMNIDSPLKVDGIYGVGTRSVTASLCRAMGLQSAERAMAQGVTPELRIKLRNKNLTAAEKQRRDSKARKDYRTALRRKWGDTSPPKVHPFTRKTITDDWGFQPGHDGVDIITPENAIVFAPVKCKVIDVRKDGWWALGAPSNPTVRQKGDGIIQLQILETVGPFKKGDVLGYGHAEKAYVHEGQTVQAGQPVGHAGLANAWHIHLMLNDGKVGKNSAGDPIGKGNKNPRPLIDYAIKNG